MQQGLQVHLSIYIDAVAWHRILCIWLLMIWEKYDDKESNESGSNMQASRASLGVAAKPHILQAHRKMFHMHGT